MIRRGSALHPEETLFWVRHPAIDPVKDADQLVGVGQLEHAQVDSLVMGVDITDLLTTPESCLEQAIVVVTHESLTSG